MLIRDQYCKRKDKEVTLGRRNKTMKQPNLAGSSGTYIAFRTVSYLAEMDRPVYPHNTLLLDVGCPWVGVTPDDPVA